MMQQRLKAKLMVARWGARRCLGQADDEQHAMEMRPKAEPLVAGVAGKEAEGQQAGPPHAKLGGAAWVWESMGKGCSMTASR